MMPDILDTLRAYFPSDENDKNQLFGKVLQNTTIDKLTGIYNSNQLLLLAEKERPRARRYNLPLSVLIISTDYKQPPDKTITSGTAVNVLQFIAENCQRNIREVDILGRYNNNELAIILPETDAQGAKHLAERLYQEISINSFQTEFGSAPVSFKIGIAEDSVDFPDAKTLIESAKKSMEANQ
jgi:diguanylate cyclase (GGDEF)-like protein